MTDLQAALGLHQLARVEDNWVKRRRVWGRYQEAFAELPLRTPAEPDPDTRHGLHLYTVLVNEDEAGIARDAFLDEMTRANIGVGVHYRCLAEFSYFQRALGVHPEDFPVATAIGRQT